MYYVNQEMLGDIATEKQARHMVALLRERGFDAEYGDGRNHESVPDDIWSECLDMIRRQSAAAATLGRSGGSVKSSAKAAASRANGKRGGRPRKTNN